MLNNATGNRLGMARPWVKANQTSLNTAAYLRCIFGTVPAYNSMKPCFVFLFVLILGLRVMFLLSLSLKITLRPQLMPNITYGMKDCTIMVCWIWPPTTMYQSLVKSGYRSKLAMTTRRPVLMYWHTNTMVVIRTSSRSIRWGPDQSTSLWAIRRINILRTVIKIEIPKLMAETMDWLN